MNTEVYIDSGIIESYVLGLASKEEIAELEAMRLKNPQVNQAIEEFSALLEEQAFQNAVVPPPSVKAKFLAAISDENDDESLIDKPTAIAPDNVVPIGGFRFWRMVAAASVILLVTSISLNFYYYNKFRERDNDYVALLNERNTLQANNRIYQTQLREWQTASQMMADSQMAMIKMPGVPGKNQHLATVFWNTQSKEVYVMPNNLPQPEEGKQFQLWALVNGKPVDAGVLDLNCTSVCKMKTIPQAQAFAITLEKKGGSPTPTMAAMYVFGKA